LGDAVLLIEFVVVSYVCVICEVGIERKRVGEWGIGHEFRVIA